LFVDTISFLKEYERPTTYRIKNAFSARKAGKKRLKKERITCPVKFGTGLLFNRKKLDKVSLEPNKISFNKLELYK